MARVVGYNPIGMIELLKGILESECLMDRGDPVLVGVSGGADSLCLMDALAQAGYQIIVAHLNHSLRPEAETENERVEVYAKRLGAQFVYDKIDVRNVIAIDHLSLEEAARTVRYQFLFSKAMENGAKAVAVGHTADDQVETILMHLLQGSGLNGLRGMLYRTIPNAWSREIPLIRPLLGTWREEIMEYIVTRGYTPVIDASNQDVTYFRNRIRHELVPLLESYNPQVRKSLLRLGHILRDDYIYIQDQVASARKECLLEAGEQFLLFSHAHCLELPVTVQRYLLKNAIEQLRPGLRDLDYDVLQRAQRFLISPSRSGRIELTSGLVLSLRENELIISDGEYYPREMDFPRMQTGTGLDLAVPGELELGGGWVIRAVLLPGSADLLEKIRENPDPFQSWIGVDGLSLPLTVRSRLPGDYLRPFGMGGHTMKLSDLMVNVKLPKDARHGWPLICGYYGGEEEILWVPGYRQSETCCVTRNTRQVARLWLERGNK